MMLSVFKLFILWINCCVTLLFVNFIKVESQRCEAQQSSTNGSFLANNACDDDMETYSLTGDDANQIWSMALERARKIFWIFLSISCGSYDIHVQLNTSKIQTCNHIERMCNVTSEAEIVTCNSSGNMFGNKIIIKKLDYGVLQIREVKSIDFSTLQEVAVKKQSIVLKGKDAFDGNLDSYIVTKENINAKWYMSMEKTYGIKWILISIRGGNYELHITAENQTLPDELTLCRVFNLLNPTKAYQNIIECERQMTGNSIIIKRTDEGPIRLFEVHPIVCPAYHYGINCAKCRKACVSCHPVSGVCNHCFGPFFGDLCQYQCPTTCLKTCDQETGSCDSCIDGHGGKYCELQMSTDYKKTEANSEQNKSSTVVIEELHVRDRDDKEDSIQFPILLVALSALVLLLLLVIIFLFVSKRKKEKINIEGESVLAINLQRSESRNESDLEEIPQNEANYVEEEVVVVEYSNLTSQRVSLDQFIREIPDKKSSGILEKEYDDLPNGLLESYSDALKALNRKGNRYKGIYPYDHNRVKLVRDRTEENEDNDFFNASYIYGFNKEQAYIAAQGPFNPKTLEDFWTVIWQNNSTRIIMLTSLYEGDK
ncbi:uncharacterized protein LOC134277412, partial [Saccostrea cucullata]|uniref:uncharacterized protein LOC134277412 n=1 Tax=Saccostrea cuccullata TaxID=36930 RepID=UPI002ED61E77